MTVENFNNIYNLFNKRFSEKVINSMIIKSHIDIEEKLTVDKKLILKKYLLDKVFQHNKKRENGKTLIHCISDKKAFINLIAKF
jgi:hypothetical protein